MSKWVITFGQPGAMVAVLLVGVALFGICLLRADSAIVRATEPEDAEGSRPDLVAAPSTTALPASDVPPVGTADDDGPPADNGAGSTHRLEPVLAGAVDLDKLTIVELCAALRESYPSSTGPDRPGLDLAQVRARGYVLDELERRDPVGFSRWLGTVPVVGSDPGSYLGAGHRDRL